MKRVLRFWADEIERNPVILAWFVFWAINARLNVLTGYEVGGGGWDGRFFGMVFLALAFVGAWAAAAQAEAVGFRRKVLIVLVIFQLIVGQMAGWQALGLTLEKGAGKMEDGATARVTTKQEIARLKAEREKIGIVAPISELEARAKLECSRTSRRYPDGEGPKCTEWKSQLANAKRARWIDARLPKLVAALGTGAKVENPNVLYDVPMVLYGAIAPVFVQEADAARVGPGDVRFGWRVFLTAVLEIIATCGLWLMGVGRLPPHMPRGADPASGGAPPAGRGNATGRVAPGGGGAAGATAYCDDNDWHRSAHDLRAGQPIDIVPQGRRLEGPAERVALPHGAERAGYAGSQSLTGAPINIYLGGRDLPQGADPAAHAPGRVAPAEAAAAAPEVATVHRIASIPDGPPVDRSRAALANISEAEQEAADVLLAFERACVVPSQGGIVSAGQLYGRYAAWAGERALAFEAFANLFSRVSSRSPDEIGGLPHYRDVALRMGDPALQAVG